MPDIPYPTLIGYGPHIYEGEVGIMITISKSGEVETAKAITGHPYFRPTLEKASLLAKFEPTIIDGSDVPKKAVIFYLITPDKEQTEERISSKLGIINGRAIQLPQPIYTKELEDLCAYGQVEIRTNVGEDGSVQYVTPISGDELLYNSASVAARQARFSPTSAPPIKMNSILVYNFPSERKCVDAGIVNKKALSIPIPSLHDHVRVGKSQAWVRVVIDENGDVIAAKVLSGHPFVRASFEAAARKAKFPPTLINGPGIRAKGVIVFRISRQRKVSI
ncbi:MAG TPA: hypothetical protein VK612_12155 [Pyrinomonadaceae bacterium]|nr:hypothetical protein [Pyrinomonadaceae bacterium]